MAKKKTEVETEVETEGKTEAINGNILLIDALRVEQVLLKARVERLEQRLDRIVAALSKSKSVRGL